MFGKVIKDMFTENDGESVDIARVLVAFGAFTGIPFFLFMTWQSVQNDPTRHFAMNEFAGAFAMILTSVAGCILSVAVKQRTDTPINRPDQQERQ